MRDIFGSDISVSYSDIGTLASNSGIFKEAHELASKSYKSDETRFVVHGTTGSNFIMIRTVSKMFKNPKILCTRNIHKSVWHACDDYGVKLKFIDFMFDDEFEMFIPPSPEMVIKSIEKCPDVNVVLLSNPTYNGISCKLDETIKLIREFNNELIVFVDEAWGAHFVFHPQLPKTAMECDADVSVQSIHKQGGALQQTSMLHWKRGRIDEEKLMESYRSYTTTSPSYHLMASLDATREAMQRIGKKEIDREIKYAREFKDFLREETKIRVFDDFKEKWKDYIDEKYDKTKILMSLKNYGCTGFDINKKLLKHKIVSEKYSMNNVIFIITFQVIENYSNNMEKTKNAFLDIFKDIKTINKKELITFPKTENRDFDLETKIIKLKDAIGKFAAESIIPYPPGIPLVIKGDVITQEILNFIQKTIKNEIHIFKETVLDEIKIFDVVDELDLK